MAFSLNGNCSWGRRWWSGRWWAATIVGAPLAATASFTLTLIFIAPLTSLDEEVAGGASTGA
jgi:hypothetical protein